MYICPICGKGFENKERITKHSLRCWREHNPYHKSKPAPCSGNLHQSQMTNDIADFFTSFERNKYGRSKT